MPLQSWEAEAFFGPPPGSNGAGGGGGGGGGGSGGLDAFAPPGSSGRGRGSGRGSTTRGRGSGRGRWRGTSSPAGPAGGRGRLPRASRAASTPSSGAGTDDFALNSPQAEPQRRRTARALHYPRKPTSGPASLLVQLLLFEGKGMPEPDKPTLQAAAQRFCDDPMEAPTGPHNTAHTRYGAWASMTKLEAKDLVRRTTRGGRNHTFSLLPEGRAIAGRLLRENSALYTGNGINAHGGGGGGGGVAGGGGSGGADSGGGSSGGGGGNGGRSSSSSSSPNPFSPPRQSGGPAGNPARKSGISPVQNPYAASRGVSTSSSSKGGGIGRSGSSNGVKNPAGVAAEARSSKDVASKAAAAAAATTSVGTTRGRALQERGKEKHAKRAKLYDAVSPGSQCYHCGLAPSPDAGSLLAVLEQCGQVSKQPVNSNSAARAATAAASSAADSGSSINKHERGGGGDGVSEEGLGINDDDWMALTSRPAKKSGPVILPSSPPLRNRRASIVSSKTTLGVSKRTGVSAVPRSAPSSTAPGSAASPSAEFGGSERQKRETNIVSPSAAAAAGVGDVVDISLSDDEQDDDDVVMTPPPDRRAGAISSSSSSSRSSRDGTSIAGGPGVVGDGVTRAPGPSGVVPLVSPTLFRSMARGPGTVVGPSDSGAMNWRGRACPAWLQRELDAGTLSPGDRMVDAFDLVLIADCAEQEESMREVRAKLQSSLSQQSFSLGRAGLGVAPSSGMGLEIQVAKLQVADFAWAWRRKRTGNGARGTPITSGAQEEVLLLDCMVERKSDHDIVGSIEGLGGRYPKQKRRMRLSGMSRLIYLLEGQLAGFHKPTTGEDKSQTIRTAEVETLIQGFVIKRVQNTHETAAFLLSLSLQLMGSQGTETIREFCANPSRPKVSFREWSTAMNPGNFEPPTVNLVFGKCLLMVDRLGAEGARVIASKFGTPKRLFDALRRCSSLKEQTDLVQHLKLSDGGKNAGTRTVGPTAAKRMVSLFADKTACFAAC